MDSHHFEDEQAEDLACADRGMAAMLSDSVVVPPIRRLEVVNGFVRTELSVVMATDHGSAFLQKLGRLRIAVDGAAQVFTWMLQFARRYRLSSCDAAYPELASRRRLPLATLDADLRQAATRAGAEIFA